MPARIYCDLPLAPSLTVELPSDSVRHVQVLRMQPDDLITLFTGRAGEGEWDARIVRMTRSSVHVEIVVHRLIERENLAQIHVAVAVPANDRMDTLVEKATELGVSSITPLLAQRSVWKSSADKVQRKVEHWQGVAIAACAQCGRNTVPTIHALQTLGAWLDSAPWQNNASLWIAHPNLSTLACHEQSSHLEHWVLIGPEGGWSDAEVEWASQRGFQSLSLGPRVLRTDTAVWAAVWNLSSLPQR